METVAKKLYEAMFLVDSALAGSDWDGVTATIRSILQRAEAEVVSLRKWADRRLAYQIDHKTKGTYVLCYFRADGGRIGDIERDVRLSERIMRVLILSAEHISQENIEKETRPLIAASYVRFAIQHLLISVFHSHSLLYSWILCLHIAQF